MYGLRSFYRVCHAVKVNSCSIHVDRWLGKGDGKSIAWGEGKGRGALGKLGGEVRSFLLIVFLCGCRGRIFSCIIAGVFLCLSPFFSCLFALRGRAGDALLRGALAERGIISLVSRFLLYLSLFLSSVDELKGIRL